MKKGKQPAKPAKPKDSPATSRTPFEADLDPDFLDRLRCMEKQERKEIGDLLREICASFGVPHVHAGIGIRDLGKGFYEGRDGLEHRVLFERIGPRALYFHMIGDHDDIRRFLKTHR